MDFPTLSRPPASADFGQKSNDKTLRAPTESGYEFTRTQAARRLRRTLTVKYELMSQADFDAMTDFVDNQVFGTAGSFNWDHPLSHDTLIVRFAEGELPEYKYVGYANGGPTWEFGFKITEV